MKNIKKPLIFTLILGLLAGNSLSAMSFDFDNLNVQTAKQAFLLGLLTPQTPRFGHISTILTALVSLKSTLKTGNLNNLAYNKNNYTLLKVPAYGIPLYVNYVAYAVGYLLRLGIATTHAKFTPKVSDSSFERLLDTILNGVGAISFHGMCAGVLAYNIWAPHIDYTYKQCLTTLCLETLGTTQNNNNTQQIQNIKNMFKEGAEPHKLNPHPLTLALEKNIPELLNVLIEDTYKNPEYLFNSKHFEILVQKNEQDLCMKLFNNALEIYNKNPEQFTINLINIFTNILHNFKNPSQEERKILEQLLEQLQTMNNDPSHYKISYSLFGTALFKKEQYDTRHRVISDTLHHCNMPEEFTTNSYLFHNYVKYLAETGMPIYSFEIDHFPIPPTKHETFENTDNNPIMRNYLKMVGQYNKKLLTDKESLENFIHKLDADQQDDIFRIAATRGHMYALHILSKIDPEEYSLEQAAHVALSRRCEKTFKKYLSLSPELHTYFKKMFSLPQDAKDEDLSDDQKFFERVNNSIKFTRTEITQALDKVELTKPQKQELITCIHDTLSNDPAKLVSMIACLQKHEQDKSILSSIKRIK